MRNISIKGETYDELINKLISTREKFESEIEFRKWFEENYTIFGFEDIIESKRTEFPGYKVLKDGEELNVELETLSSNFITHGHDPEKVDIVICLIEDEELPVKTIEITEFEFKDIKSLDKLQEETFEKIRLIIGLLKSKTHEEQIETTLDELSRRLGKSRKIIGKWLNELSEINFLEQEINPENRVIKITENARKLIYSIWLDLEEIYSSPPESIRLTGRVTDGLGEGRYYVNQDEYRKQFEKKLGFNPYPGTLDLKLDEISKVLSERLRTSKGLRIHGFSNQERSFGGAKTFPAEVRGVKAGIVIPNRTHHEDIIEILAPVQLRDKFNLKDGDELRIEVRI